MTYLRRETKVSGLHASQYARRPLVTTADGACVPSTKQVYWVDRFYGWNYAEACHVKAPELLQAELRNRTQGASVCRKKKYRSEYFSQKQ